jgi:putative YhdH/YhfP family quinone oxidoreductase
VAADPPDRFRALVAERDGDDVRREVRELGRDDLHEGDVVVRVAWSSVNFKDALAVSATGRVARASPLVPGIDLAGEVVESGPDGPPPGTLVLAHGHDLGVAHHGGFAELARLPAHWVVPLPDGLDPRAAMAIGTAGYTAAASVLALEDRGLRPGDGPVLVLGASGGVGATAVAILAARGHEVHASTGKAAEAEFLRALGAREVLTREEVSAPAERPLERSRWAGCVDPVGGAALAYVLRTLRHGAAVATSGNTGGVALETTVLPFILRGVALLGIDSVQVPAERRREVWERLAGDLRPRALEEHGGVGEVGLDELGEHLDRVLDGRVSGRTVVRLAG